jgi:hypothetical protein
MAAALSAPAFACERPLPPPPPVAPPSAEQKATAQAAIHKLHEEKRRDTAAERKQAEALANDCRFKGDWFTLPVDDNGE